MPINSFDNYPMSWKPTLTNTKKPIYIYLADTLEADILSGKLTPGTKLPPQRELADFLDINLSTVTRAFKLCEQRGLICSVVGNGTYISSDAASNSMLMLNNPNQNIIEMGAILPNVEFNKHVSSYLQTMATEPDFYKLLQYGTIEYDDLQIQAAEKWLSYFSLSSSKEHILYSAGSQNAIFATLSALFQSGDRIATMPTTYPGLKVAAKILGIHLVPLHLEEGKITKNVLQYAYKIQKAFTLFQISIIQPPNCFLLKQENLLLIFASRKSYHSSKMQFIPFSCLNHYLQSHPLHQTKAFLYQVPQRSLHRVFALRWFTARKPYILLYKKVSMECKLPYLP